MQNIPSKSHDIRHLFRATPEQKELLKVEPADKTITLKLSKYDSVPTFEGQTEVRNLKEGSIVIFKENNVDVNCKITSIEFDKGNANITFQEGG